MNNSNDLEILISTHDLTLAGQPVTVREYTLEDSVIHAADIDVLVLAFAGLFQKSVDIRIEQVQEIVAANPSVLWRLLAAATDKSASWVARLPAADGYELFNWWWIQNSRFFMNVASNRAQLLQLRQQEVRSKNS
jgi:hypothetical protein